MNFYFTFLFLFRMIKSWKDEIVIVIKAPQETKLEVPPPQKVNGVSLKSIKKNIINVMYKIVIETM